MISIIIQGEALELYPDTTLNITFLTNALNFGPGEGSFSWGFTLPNTPLNRRLLGQPARFDHAIYPDGLLTGAKLLYRGQLFRICNIRIEEPGERSFTITVSTDTGLLSQIAEQPLRQVAEQIITFSSTNITALNTFLTEDLPITFFPFYEGNGQYNEWNSATNMLQGAICPQPKLWAIAEAIFRKIGYVVDWQTTAFPDLRKLCFLNTVRLSSSAFRTTTRRDGTVTGLTTLPPTANLKDFCPEITVSQFLTSCMATFGLSFFPNPLTEKVTARILDTTLRSRAVPVGQRARNFGLKKRSQHNAIDMRWPEDETDRFQEEMKDVNPDEFYQAPEQEGLLPYPNPVPDVVLQMYLARSLNSRVVVRYPITAGLAWEAIYADLFPKKVTTRPQTPEGVLELRPAWRPAVATAARYLRYDPSSRLLNRVRLRQNASNPSRVDIIFGGNPSLPTAQQTNRIRLFAVDDYPVEEWLTVVGSGLRNIGGGDQAFVTVEVPYEGDRENFDYELELRSETVITLSGNRAIPRLAFYHGFQARRLPGATGTYPFASAAHYDNQPLLPNKIGQFSLRWEGQEGLYDTFFKLAAPTLCADQREQEVSFSIADLANLNPGQLYAFPDGVFLLEKIEADLGTQLRTPRSLFRQVRYE